MRLKLFLVFGFILLFFPNCKYSAYKKKPKPGYSDSLRFLDSLLRRRNKIELDEVQTYLDRISRISNSVYIGPFIDSNLLSDSFLETNVLPLSSKDVVFNNGKIKLIIFNDEACINKLDTIFKYVYNENVNAIGYDQLQFDNWLKNGFGISDLLNVFFVLGRNRQILFEEQIRLDGEFINKVDSLHIVFDKAHSDFRSVARFRK
jgi:hypothetical protein